MATRNVKLLKSLRSRAPPEAQNFDAQKLNKCQHYNYPDVEVKDDAQMLNHKDDQTFAKIDLDRLVNKSIVTKDQMKYVLRPEKTAPHEDFIERPKPTGQKTIDKTGKRLEKDSSMHMYQGNNNSENLPKSNKQIRLHRSLSKVNDFLKPRRYNCEEQEKFDGYGKKDTIFEVLKSKDNHLKKLDYTSSHKYNQIINKNPNPDLYKKDLVENDKPWFEKKALDQDEKNFVRSDFVKGKSQKMYEIAMKDYISPKDMRYPNEDIQQAYSRLSDELIRVRPQKGNLNHYDDIEHRNIFYQPKIQNVSINPQYAFQPNNSITNRQSSARNNLRPQYISKAPSVLSGENTIKSINQSESKNFKRNEGFEPTQYTKGHKIKAESVSCHMGYSWDPNVKELVDLKKKYIRPIIQSTKNLLMNKGRFDCDGVVVDSKDLLVNTNDSNYRYGHGYKPQYDQGNFHRVHVNYFLN